MKEFINKFKNMEKTKKLVILFITISFVFILSITSYNALTDNFEKNTDVATTENIKEDENDKDENKESYVEDAENQTDEETKDEEDEKKAEENTSTTNKENSSSNSKQTNKSETSTNKNGTSGTTDNQSNNSNSNQTNSNNNSSTNSSQEKETISIHIQVIGMGETMMSGNLTVEKGSNAYSVLKEIADKNGISISGSKYYVSGIGNLKEKQHGPLSGWMYKVNGTSPNTAAYYYKLNNGDNVVWYYVNYE